MQDPFFCLGTTLVGINVPDAYLLANYHKVINFLPNACEEKEQKINIQGFLGILAQQLIDTAKKISGPPQRFLPEESEGDNNGNLHCLVRYEVTKDPSGWQRTKMRKCMLCIMKNK
jgi:hypothetical protein